MGSYLNLYIFNILFLTACRNVELASSSARCDRSPKILHARQGEIHSPTHYTWSLHPLNCSWLIPAAVGERVILSFSQFSMRCGRDWVSVTSQTGYPISLCGSQLPRPVELTGGNITVTHHFLQRMYPLSGFSLEYIRDSGPCFPGEFECYSERCLPASWRCNGQVECLGEEDEMGSDEEDCDYDSGLRPRVEATSADLATTARTVTEPELHAGAGDVSQQGTCGGLLQKFYGSFWPLVLSGPAMECVWTVDPQDLRPLRLELQLLELGPGDTITITNQPNGTGGHIKTITCTSNYKVVEVESRTGKLSLTYRTQPGSEGRGFNATYRIADYCLPWEELCRGSEGGCYTRKQRCDGHWDCVETGLDEEGCGGCPAGQFPCGGTQRSSHFGVQTGCFSAKERCNYQLNCADGSDERDCTICRPGTFHCDSDRCVFESWRCDGQVDCKDGTDELNCTVTLPRKVITAATVGSLVCGLLLVIAMGCTCKLYSLRTREYSMFAPITRQEAEMIQQQAPPSYGQLIAQGIIPPVEDFPTENPNETSSLSLRGILQLLRQDGAASPRRRRRPRFVRRAVRRLRRWGFLPRPVSRPSQTTSSTSQQTEASPAGSEPSQSSPEGSSLARESVSQTLPQKLCMLPQTEQQQPAEPPVPPPSPPTAALPPITNSEMPQTPTTAVLPNSPSLASIFHSLGLSISLFRPSSSSPTSLQLSSSPSFSSSSSDDEVLLIPLSDDTTSEDDVPMLT